MRLKIIEMRKKWRSGACPYFHYFLGETLTLLRLGLFEQQGMSLNTANCIESLNSQLAQYTRRVTYWKTVTNDSGGSPRPCWKSNFRLES